MTVSYDPTLADSISVIRLYIGDTVENNGPRPDNKNYSDEEITAILSRMTGNVNGAIGTLFEVLAAEWTKFAVSYTIGPRKEELFRIAKRYDEKAQQWSIVAGTLYTNFSSGLIRRNANTKSVA